MLQNIRPKQENSGGPLVKGLHDPFLPRLSDFEIYPWMTMHYFENIPAYLERKISIRSTFLGFWESKSI